MPNQLQSNKAIGLVEGHKFFITIYRRAPHKLMGEWYVNRNGEAALQRLTP
jgi:hypothetical protein